jgi:hypothetical protein
MTGWMIDQMAVASSGRAFRMNMRVHSRYRSRPKAVRLAGSLHLKQLRAASLIGAKILNFAHAEATILILHKVRLKIHSAGSEIPFR